MGGGFGFSSNKSKSQGSGYNMTRLSEMQAPFLENLFQQAQGVAGQQMGGIGQAAQGFANQGLGSIASGFGSMQAGANALSPFTNPNNQLANQQIGLLGQDINRQFTRDIMPSLTQSAIGGGGLGGSRGQIAAGLAAQGAQDAFSRGALGIRSNAYNQAQQAAGLQGSMLQGLGQAQIGAAGDIYNLGLSPFQAQFAPLQQLAGILGSPIMESFARNYSRSTGSGTGMSVG
jgi:hypothetical protein